MQFNRQKKCYPIERVWKILLCRKDPIKRVYSISMCEFLKLLQTIQIYGQSKIESSLKFKNIWFWMFFFSLARWVFYYGKIKEKSEKRTRRTTFWLSIELFFSPVCKNIAYYVKSMKTSLKPISIWFLCEKEYPNIEQRVRRQPDYYVRTQKLIVKLFFMRAWRELLASKFYGNKLRFLVFIIVVVLLMGIVPWWIN